MTQAKAADPRALRSLRVLVVDDDEPTRSLMARLLGRLKVAEVVQAENGAEGLARFAAGRFDIVLVDWNMPVMSGLEFFQQVHALEPGLPFVMVTGRSDVRSIAAARHSGITAYVVKPVSEVELRAKLRFAIAARAASAA